MGNYTNEGGKMGRPKGAPNKPKTAQDLLDKITAEYSKQGKKLKYSIDEMGEMSDAEKAVVIAASAENPNVNIPDVFELESSEDDTEDGDNEDGEDTFKCGNCQEELAGELPVCPSCGASLKWS